MITVKFHRKNKSGEVAEMPTHVIKVQDGAIPREGELVHFYESGANESFWIVRAVAHMYDETSADAPACVFVSMEAVRP